MLTHPLPLPLPPALTPQVATPPDDKVDRVSFLMNNLTPGNLGPKGRDLAGLVLPTFTEWFSNYLVVKRAAQVGPWACTLRLTMFDQC